MVGLVIKCIPTLDRDIVFQRFGLTDINAFAEIQYESQSIVGIHLMTKPTIVNSPIIIIVTDNQL
jgi:hypothetical protein